MARNITTQSIEAENKVGRFIDVFDLFFVMGYIGLSIVFKDLVADQLSTAFMIFSAFMALFLTLKSPYNKKRRNFESLYFLITRDVVCYKPFYAKAEDTQ